MRVDRRIAVRLAVAVPFALVALAAARWWRGYEWTLAVITGLALGGLVFVTLRTWDRMRDLFRG